MYGQDAGAGSGRKGRASAASAPEAAATSTVVRSGSAPPLTMAFQVACSAAPSRTAAKTDAGMALPGPEPTRHRASPGEREVQGM